MARSPAWSGGRAQRERSARALGRNPIPIIIPCHRVLAADGRSGGFSAPGGVSTKLRLLDIERARRGAQPGLFDGLGWAAKS
jgi:methylated-DNA-[protein]-cysteine S-methyltransferase